MPRFKPDHMLFYLDPDQDCCLNYDKMQWIIKRRRGSGFQPVSFIAGRRSTLMREAERLSRGCLTDSALARIPPRPPQDHHAGRGPAPERHGRADGVGRPDQRRPPGLVSLETAHWAVSSGQARTTQQGFEVYVRHVLAPTLRPGDVVIMDNPSSHKRAAARKLIEAAGAELLFLPPYSPDFNPIEMAFSKLKALLRRAAERTVQGLWDAIGRLVDLITPNESANFFTAAGYEPE